MKKALTIISVLATASCALAGTIYSDQAAFMNAVAPGYFLEDFGAPEVSVLLPDVVSDGTYAWSAQSDNVIYIWGADTAGSTPCVGSVGTQNEGYDITFTFSGAPVTAFGGDMYVTDMMFLAVEGDMTVALDDGTSVLLHSPYLSSFVGFTSDVPITSVTLSPDPDSANELYLTFDNIVVGTAVPEPASLGLLGLGLLVGLRRR